MRYYFQQEPASLRRYSDSPALAQRWNQEEQRWDNHCAAEESCRLTRDRRIPENEALAMVRAR